MANGVTLKTGKASQEKGSDVRTADVFVSPSPWEAVGKTIAGLSEIFGKKEEQEMPLADMLAQMHDYGTARKKELEDTPGAASQRAWAGIRNDMDREAIDLARKMKLGVSDTAAFMKQYREMKNSSFGAETFQDAILPGGIRVTTMDGDPLHNRLDPEAYAVDKATKVMEQMPLMGARLLAESTGTDVDGSPLTGSDAEIAKRRNLAISTISKLTGDLESIEAKTLEYKYNKAQYDQIKLDNDAKRELSIRHKASIGGAVRSLAATKMRSLLMNPDLLKSPPEYVAGIVESELMALRNSPEIIEFETAFQDTEYVDGIIKSATEQYNKIFTGSNMLTLRKYTVENQEAILNSLANEQVLEQGPLFAGLFKNADGFQKYAQAAITLDAYTKARGSSETAFGAGLVRQFSGESLSTFNGLITELEVTRDPQEKVPEVSGVLNHMSQAVNQYAQSFTEGGSAPEMTPHALLEMIYRAKTSNGLTEFLQSKNIPIEKRKRILNAINTMESNVLRLSGLPQSDVDELRRSFKLAEIYTTGIPVTETE